MAADDITIENLRQLLHIQTELREQAESQWRKAQRVLVGLLESFAPEEVDQRLKSGQPLDHLPVDELEKLVRQQIGSRLHQVQSLLKESQSTQRVEALREQVEKMIDQAERSKEEGKRLQDQINRLEAEKIDLLNQLAALRAITQAEPPAIIADHLSPSAQDSSQPPEPDWMAAWRKTETFERDSSILKMIAETGLARRPLIEAQVAGLLGIKKPGGSIQALMTRLEERDLIEVLRPWSGDGAGSGGRLPDLLRLTEQGRLAYWLRDIAGFGGGLPDPDLYLRATAMAVFCPIMQYHSDFNDRRLLSRDRTPWNVQAVTGDQEVLPVFRKFVNLRMNLVPYIASEALASCQTGLPLMRALTLEYPLDRDCAGFPFQYLFGSSLLVAPVTTPGDVQLQVYLPKGVWTDLWTGEIHHGPNAMTMPVPRDRIPVFLGSGAILPLNLGETFTLSNPVGNSVERYQNLCFKISPQGESSFKWYDYTRQETGVIRCRQDADGKSVSIQLPAIPYPVHLILPGSKIETAEINGDKIPTVEHQLKNQLNAFYLHSEKNEVILRVHANQGAQVAIQFFR